MSEHQYRVVVTREDGHWLADMPELDGAHTYARSLPALDHAIREVVVLAAGLPDEAMSSLALEYDYRTGDPELDITALEVRRLRREPATRRERCAPAAACLARRRTMRSWGNRLTMIVMWQVRLRILVARPRARGRQRFMVAPSSA